MLALALAAAMVPAPAGAADENMDDRSVENAIEAEIVFDPAVRFNDVDVEVLNGIVTLSGTVDNLLSKQRAERLASIVKGVRSVVNRIEVETRVAGGRLAERVEKALLTDPATDSFEIEVQAQEGKVRLTGNVDSWGEKELATRVASGVDGVRAVDNQLAIEYEAERPDVEIRPEIEARLRWDALVDDALIDVEVEDGRVTLSGTVGSLAEKQRAVNDAWVAGVKSVEAGDLEVARWARDEALREDKYVVKPDESIEDAVVDALAADPRVKFFEVLVDVDRGQVTLRGTVDNLKAKRAAAQTARNTVGVTWVKNRLKVRPVIEYTDKQIAERVEHSLLRDPFVNRYDVDVEVNAGTVYLEGQVDQYFQKAQADDVAARVNGVLAVENNLRVDDDHRPLVYIPRVDDWVVFDFDWYDYEPAVSIKSDEAIAEDIKDQLFWSPFVDADEVHVEVEAGTASLTGQVDSQGEKYAALENAVEGGAVWVVNRLDVEPGD